MDLIRPARRRARDRTSRTGVAGLATLLALLTMLLPGSVAASTPTPANDLIGGATVVSGLPFEDSVDTDLATGTRTDPRCDGNGHSVWYSFTPTTDVDLQFVVSGDFDSTVAIYTGPIRDLRTLVCSDTPEGRVRVKANVRHLIKVASWMGQGGGPMTIRLDVYGPPTIDITGITAVVKPVTGDVVVRATVTCTKAGGAWFDTLILRQRRPDGTIVAGFPVRGWNTTCDGRPQVLRVLVGADRAFTPGPARLVYTVAACGVSLCASASDTPIIRIGSAS